jgi:hypothetical protein
MAMYVFGLSLLGFGVLAIAATVLHDPWSTEWFDITAACLAILVAISVWTYFIPRGIPAAVSVCVMSLLIAIVLSLVVIEEIRRAGINAPDWLEWLVSLAIFGTFSPWIVKRTSAAYRGELFDE